MLFLTVRNRRFLSIFCFPDYICCEQNIKRHIKNRQIFWALSHSLYPYKEAIQQLLLHFAVKSANTHTINKFSKYYKKLQTNTRIINKYVCVSERNCNCDRYF